MFHGLSENKLADQESRSGIMGTVVILICQRRVVWPLPLPGEDCWHSLTSKQPPVTVTSALSSNQNANWLLPCISLWIVSPSGDMRLASMGVHCGQQDGVQVVSALLVSSQTYMIDGSVSETICWMGQVSRISLVLHPKCALKLILPLPALLQFAVGQGRDVLVLWSSVFITFYQRLPASPVPPVVTHWPLNVRPLDGANGVCCLFS